MVEYNMVTFVDPGSNLGWEEEKNSQVLLCVTSLGPILYVTLTKLT